MTTKKQPLHEADRPRVHKDLRADAAEIRWTHPGPPLRPGGDTLVQVPHAAQEAIRVDGIWIAPGEFAHVPADEAKRLRKEGVIDWAK